MTSHPERIEEALSSLPLIPVPEALVARVMRDAAQPVVVQRPRAAPVAVLWLAALASVGMAVVGVWSWRRPAGPAVEPMVAAPAGEPAVLVESSTGDVEIERGGVRRRLEDGVEPGDVIRTAAAGGLSLRLGHVARLMIDERSQVRWVDGRTFEVQTGRAEGRLLEAAGAARLAFVHGRGSVTLVHGAIGVLELSGQGLVVAAIDRDALIEVAGREVLVPRQHYVDVADALGTPRALAADLALQLSQRGLPSARDGRVTVAGRTDPRVLLVINDIAVPVTADGAFAAEIAVPRDAASLEAVVLDPAGRKRTVRLPVVRARTHAGWKKPG